MTPPVSGTVRTPSRGGDPALSLYHLFDQAVLANPYPLYHRLRDLNPVHHASLGMWVLSRYDDGWAAMRDPRMSSSACMGLRATRATSTRLRNRSRPAAG